jgi:hypothetical protein
MAKTIQDLRLGDSFFIVKKHNIADTLPYEGFMGPVANHYTYDRHIVRGMELAEDSDDITIVKTRESNFEIPRIASRFISSDVEKRFYFDETEVAEMCEELTKAELNRVEKLISFFKSSERTLANIIEGKHFS